MKKKLFLMLIVVSALVCLFAISVSATAIPEFGATEHIDIDKATDGVQEMDIYGHLKTVVTDGTNPSANARVLLNCSCEKGQHTYPTYYITQKDNGDYIWTKYNDINTYNPCGKTYSNADVVAIEIPNGIKVMTNVFKANTTIKFLDMSTAETMQWVETGGGYNAVSNCTSLIEVRIPASMTEIRGWAFFSCTSLERFVIPEDSELTFIGTYTFYNCTSLTGFYLPSKMKTFGTQGGTNYGVFAGCPNVYLVNEPVTPTYIPPKPSVYYFPSTFKKMSGEEFKNCTSMNETVVFPETFTSVSDRWTFNGASTKTVVFLGDMTELGAQYWSCTSIYFANKADKQRSDIATFTNPSGASVYYCNAEGNTNHLAEKTVDIPASCEIDAGVATLCFCGAQISKTSIEGTALSHDYDYVNGNATLVAVIYKDLSMDGTKTVTCGICGVDNNTIKADKVFNYLGYSKDGKGGFCMGYLINQEALKDYESKNGSVVYGFIASANNDTPLDASGNKEENVVQTVLTDSGYTAIDFILTAENWEDEAVASAKITLNMYVIVNNAVQYITQNGYSTTAEAYKYSEI